MLAGGDLRQGAADEAVVAAEGAGGRPGVSGGAVDEAVVAAELEGVAATGDEGDQRRRVGEGVVAEADHRAPLPPARS